jgi:chorismate synthase
LNTIGTCIKATFFGESHGPVIGVVIDGLPAGLLLDENSIRQELDKRKAPGVESTSRQEPDHFEFLSGVKNNRSTGAALCVLIPNQTIHREDYSFESSIPRPSHVDYPAAMKYKGAADLSGGGIFSGRLTALWVVAGTICRQILNLKQIRVVSHIETLHQIKDVRFDQTNVNNELLKTLEDSAFPVIISENEPKMRAAIIQAKNDHDSVGGVIETAIVGLPPGIGEPLFQSFESVLSQVLFSIPAIKGIEFGSGFSLATMMGSEANDPYQMQAETVVTSTNHNGGILGGLSTGMPVIFRVVVKPTPTIPRLQASVDLRTKTNTTILVGGRHDPCIVHRAVHVVRAASLFATLDLCRQSHDWDWFGL